MKYRVMYRSAVVQAWIPYYFPTLKAAKKIGFKIRWVGNGVNEKAIDIKNKKVIIECKKRYFRPVEVDYLKGNANKAKKLLKWFPKTSLDKLIDEMIRYELKFYNDKL